jgi:hypothetical protein
LRRSQGAGCVHAGWLAAVVAVEAVAVVAVVAVAVAVEAVVAVVAVAVAVEAVEAVAGCVPRAPMGCSLRLTCGTARALGGVVWCCLRRSGSRVMMTLSRDAVPERYFDGGQFEGVPHVHDCALHGSYAAAVRVGRRGTLVATAVESVRLLVAADVPRGGAAVPLSLNGMGNKGVVRGRIEIFNVNVVS